MKFKEPIKEILVATPAFLGSSRYSVLSPRKLPATDRL